MLRGVPSPKSQCHVYVPVPPEAEPVKSIGVFSSPEYESPASATTTPIITFAVALAVSVALSSTVRVAIYSPAVV